MAERRRSAQGDLRPAALGLPLGFWKVSAANWAFFTAYYTLNPVLPLAALQTGATPGDMGYVLSLASGLQILVALFVVGPRINVRPRGPFLMGGALFYIVIPLLLPDLHRFPAFLAAGALTGVGVGFFSSSSAASVLSFAAPERRGFAIGIYGTLTSVAVVIGPALGIHLLATSLRIVAVFTAALGALALLIAATVHEPARPAEAASPPGSGGRFIVPAVVPPALVITAMSMMYGVLLAYLPKDMLNRGMADPGFFFSAEALAVILVRFLAGRASDRLPKALLIVPGSLAMIAAVASIGTGAPIALLYPLGVLFGLGYGVTYPATQTLMAEWAGSRQFGTSMATFSAAFTGGIGLGTALMGPVVAWRGYDAAFVATAVLSGVPLAVFVRAYRHRTGGRGSVRNA